MIAELSLFREFLLLVPSCVFGERMNISIPCAVHNCRAQGHMWIPMATVQRKTNVHFLYGAPQGNTEQGTRPHPMDTGPKVGLNSAGFFIQHNHSGQSYLEAVECPFNKQGLP